MTRSDPADWPQSSDNDWIIQAGPLKWIHATLYALEPRSVTEKEVWCAVLFPNLCPEVKPGGRQRAYASRPSAGETPALLHKMSDLVAKGVATDVASVACRAPCLPASVRSHIVSRLCNPPKEKWRQTEDCYSINDQVVSTRFKMGTLRSRRNTITTESAASGRTSPTLMCTLRCIHRTKPPPPPSGGEVLPDTALIFGPCPTPGVYTRLKKAPLKIAHFNGNLVVAYLDDLFILGETSEATTPDHPLYVEVVRKRTPPSGPRPVHRVDLGVRGRSDVSPGSPPQLRSDNGDFGMGGISLAEKHGRHLTDNTPTMFYMNKGGGRASRLFQVLEPLMKIFRTMNTTWEAQHVPGAENVLADLDLRQQRDRSEWHFNPVSFPGSVRPGRITLRLNFSTGRAARSHPVIKLELFAMGANRFQDIPKCCTLDPQDFEAHATVTDTFSIPWTYWRYANPPGLSFPLLLALSIAEPIPIIHSQDTFWVQSGIPTAQPPRTLTVAWQLSSISGARLSAALFSSSRSYTSLPRDGHTTSSGPLGFVGCDQRGSDLVRAPAVEQANFYTDLCTHLKRRVLRAGDAHREIAPEPPRARIDGASGADGDRTYALCIPPEIMEAERRH
ncbi:hypothetical protein BDZ88DRAFT_456329 [Geranomyces variabilis]|nr:hypothetical protein BDZ88DRAFT_456329 [Geranomyces variabilis]KAJ3131192.1 hypothetical protein HDU90_008678 [Geranomyces variabilis]